MTEKIIIGENGFIGKDGYVGLNGIEGDWNNPIEPLDNPIGENAVIGRNAMVEGK